LNKILLLRLIDTKESGFIEERRCPEQTGLSRHADEKRWIAPLYG
jgi:hypothetical protein